MPGHSAQGARPLRSRHAALIDHIDLLAKRELGALRKICGVNEEDLADMIAEIRQLNPKPGLAFGSTVVQPIVPDVFVRPSTDGSFMVELNSDTLPKVLVNQTYYTQVTKSVKNDKEKSYLADCLQTATWLIRALDQRAKTILKVSDGDRPPAGRVLRSRRAASAAAQSQDRRRRDRHARVDGVARHRQQIHGDQPRHLRIEIFLHLGDRVDADGGEAHRPRRCVTASSS